MDDAAEVLAANARYYRAFESLDLDAMSALWERSDRVTCTHPGWGCLRGWGAVASSFAALFQSAGGIQFVLTRPVATVAGDAAWVNLDEDLLGEQSGVTVATLNLFVRHAGGWRQVGHHGSVVHVPGDV